MSDPTLSDIDFKNEMSRLWTSLNFSNTIESLAFKNGTSKYEFLGQLRTWVEKRLVEKIKNGKKN